MILTSLEVPAAEFKHRTGWAIKPEGACRDDRCVPLPDGAHDPVDVQVLAERLGMPLVRDDAAGLWALGPEAGGPALASAIAPELELPDADGSTFRLESVRGQKVLLVAWASW